MAAVETMRLSGMAAGMRRVSNDAPLTPQRVAALPHGPSRFSGNAATSKQCVRWHPP